MVSDWAACGIFDALEVWSTPFASQRAPHYWEKDCHELELVPMAGTDCHSGREQELGGVVKNHPEIPPLIYAKFAVPVIATARDATALWQAYFAWRKAFEINHAHQEAIRQCASLVSRLVSARV